MSTEELNKDKHLAEFFADLDDELIQDYKSQGKLHPDFLPFVTYDLVQCGYPYPDHGEMIARRHGGTDAQDRLLPSNGEWCKAEDMKAVLSKWQESNRWRSFTKDELPPIGLQILCRKSDSYHLSKPASHDGIHWLAENFIEWKPI